MYTWWRRGVRNVNSCPRGGAEGYRKNREVKGNVEYRTGNAGRICRESPFTSLLAVRYLPGEQLPLNLSLRSLAAQAPAEQKALKR